MSFPFVWLINKSLVFYRWEHKSLVVTQEVMAKCVSRVQQIIAQIKGQGSQKLTKTGMIAQSICAELLVYLIFFVIHLTDNIIVFNTHSSVSDIIFVGLIDILVKY